MRACQGDHAAVHRLVLIRHAIAEDRELAAARGLRDDARPLTERGRQRFQAALPALAGLLSPVDIVLTSPLTRTRQTAELLREALPGVPLEETPLLAPEGSPAEVLAAVRQRAVGTVVLVGHEPDLGRLASWALGGVEAAFVRFKKGGAALLEFPDELLAGGALLRWLLTPAQLRSLA